MLRGQGKWLFVFCPGIHFCSQIESTAEMDSCTNFKLFRPKLSLNWTKNGWKCKYFGHFKWSKVWKVVKIDLFLGIFGKIFGKKFRLPKQANFWYQYRYQKCTKVFKLLFSRKGVVHFHKNIPKSKTVTGTHYLRTYNWSAVFFIFGVLRCLLRCVATIFFGVRVKILNSLITPTFWVLCLLQM